jgi:DNA-binding transcriptional LysR family regulator
MLVRLDSTITTRPSFDPATSDRVFRIFVSDYTQLVFVPHLLALAHAERCNVRFDFLPQVADPQRSLERGEADLLIIPRGLMSPDHPQELLYTEQFVCVTWRHGALADGALTLDRYLAAGHVVMQPHDALGESFEGAFARRHGVVRRVAVSSYGFSALPAMVVGTDLVATVHARLARLLQTALPITLHTPPLPIDAMEQALQWHQYRTLDPGLAWLRELMKRSVQRMDAQAPG